MVLGETQDTAAGALARTCLGQACWYQQEERVRPPDAYERRRGLGTVLAPALLTMLCGSGRSCSMQAPADAALEFSPYLHPRPACSGLRGRATPRPM